MQKKTIEKKRRAINFLLGRYQIQKEIFYKAIKDKIKQQRNLKSESSLSLLRIQNLNLQINEIKTQLESRFSGGITTETLKAKITEQGFLIAIAKDLKRKRAILEYDILQIQKELELSFFELISIENNNRMLKKKENRLNGIVTSFWEIMEQSELEDRICFLLTKNNLC